MLSLADHAPHPNAARLYANWLLSREGQVAWQDAFKEPSLRVDVPRTNVRPTAVLKPGVRYVDGTTEAYKSFDETAVNNLITQALDKAKRSL